MSDKTKWKLRFLKVVGVPNPEKCDLGYNFDKCSGELLSLLSEQDSELLLYYVKDNKSVEDLADEYKMKSSNVRSCIYYAESLAKWSGLDVAFYKGYHFYENFDKPWERLPKQEDNMDKSTSNWMKFYIPNYLFDVSLAELPLSRRAITVLNKLGFYRFKDLQDYFGGIMYGNTPQLKGLGVGVVKELSKKFPEIGIDVLEVSDNL